MLYASHYIINNALECFVIIYTLGYLAYNYRIKYNNILTLMFVVHKHRVYLTDIFPHEFKTRLLL